MKTARPSAWRLQTKPSDTMKHSHLQTPRMMRDCQFTSGAAGGIPRQLADAKFTVGNPQAITHADGVKRSGILADAAIAVLFIITLAIVQPWH